MSWPWKKRRSFNCPSEVDERNRDYPVSAIFDELSGGLYPVTKLWNCRVHLDQGKEGACVGYAIAHELAAEPVCVDVSRRSAHRIYHDAQKVDEWLGEGYEGTSVTAGMRVAKKMGRITEYRWAFGINDLVLAVGHLGPSVLGINWYAGMEKPDANGYIQPTGGLRGGHAILCKGYNLSTDSFTLHNSWGNRWGVGGDCYITKGDMNELLKQGGVAALPLKRQ